MTLSQSLLIRAVTRDGTPVRLRVGAEPSAGALVEEALRLWVADLSLAELADPRTLPPPREEPPLDTLIESGLEIETLAVVRAEPTVPGPRTRRSRVS